MRPADLRPSFWTCFLTAALGPEPIGAVGLTPLQEPHDNDLRFIQTLCRVFNEDLRTAPDTRTQSELWSVLTGTRFSRSIGRFSAFSTLPFMHWLRTIESTLHLRYEGAAFSGSILMTKQRQWIEQSVKTFVRFRKPMRFEDALLREKWIRSLASGLEIGIVGFGHAGSIIGVIAIPRRKSKTVIPPHGTLSGAVSLVQPGTMAFICAPSGDLYVVLPNGAAFLKTQGKWHYLNYSSFRSLLRQHISKTIVDPVLRTILDLSFQRKGALLCFLDDNESISHLVPDNGRSGRANETLRRAVTNLDIRRTTHQQMLLAAAGVDGAVVLSKGGKVLDAACMIGEPDSAALALGGYVKLERFPGARSTAAWNASMFGLSIKISEDGPVTVYKSGKLVGQMA
jgi:hypothetical protein